MVSLRLGQTTFFVSVTDSRANAKKRDPARRPGHAHPHRAPPARTHAQDQRLLGQHVEADHAGHHQGSASANFSLSAIAEMNTRK
jgi:hypothetical protein